MLNSFSFDNFAIKLKILTGRENREEANVDGDDNNDIGSWRRDEESEIAR